MLVARGQRSERSAISGQQSAIPIPQSAIRLPPSAIKQSATFQQGLQTRPIIVIGRKNSATILGHLGKVSRGGAEARRLEAEGGGQGSGDRIQGTVASRWLSVASSPLQLTTDH